MTEEVWRPVIGWEGLYDVSNLGRVRSVKRFVRNKNSIRPVESRILKPSLGKNGYYYLRNCKGKAKYIHRMVAEAFIPNPNALPQINHKDENKLNNSVYNLEWCTQSYNLSYGNRLEKIRRISLENRNNPKRSKKVAQYDLNDVLIATYQSLHEAERITGIKQDRISQVCRNKNHHKTISGYKWKFI